MLQVCHPDWRGVYWSASAFGDPIVAASDLGVLIGDLDAMQAAGLTTLVIQGWPPNAAVFAAAAAARGLTVLAVSHSAPSQHGVDAGEAESLSEMLDLARRGVIARVGSVKAGVVDSYASIGHRIHHVPNRVPQPVRGASRASDAHLDVGIFLFPMWRKNVTTQVLAAAALGARIHVMHRPDVPYLSDVEIVEHGELGHDAFLRLMSSMHLTMNVTLSECHPMMPMESYRLGVPCLVSRTSDLFASPARLRELTTVDRADEPDAIAQAATRLLDARDEAVALASDELDRIDQRAFERWAEFTTRGGPMQHRP